jgi:hypothetical protein
VRWGALGDPGERGLLERAVTDPLALGEKLLSLLEESQRSSTYKPALLLAVIDRVQDHLDEDLIAVRALAERVIELYWPQTLPYQTTGQVLRQNNAGGQAAIITQIARVRDQHGTTARSLSEGVRRDPSWAALVTRVEGILAEWPIPRLQRPYDPFLYEFDWTWEDAGRWSARRYRDSSRAIRLFPGVGDALTSLGPLLRPFITRWWTDKAAQLNPDVEAARSVIEFEEFLFGRDRVTLDRVAESLLDLQRGDCFYCHTRLAARREIDHFIPWSYSGDDGLDNLVAACHSCNNRKRASLPGPDHVAALLDRNTTWNGDLAAIATEKHWPRDRPRSLRIARTAYLRSPDERHVWIRTRTEDYYRPLGADRAQLEQLLTASQ